MDGKPLVWLGTSLEDLRTFPAEVRRETGYQLRRLQNGLIPSDWKPMGTVGLGVCEIRIRTALEHRIVYMAKFAEAVYVLHAFEKKSRQTRRADIDLARRKLAQLSKIRGKTREE